jgi:hypothetical protein
MNKLIFILTATLVISGLFMHFNTQNQAPTVDSIDLTPEVLSLWKQFKLDFSKTYSHEEEIYRLKTFAENLIWMEQNSNEQVLFGINAFADLKSAEFASIYLSPVFKNHK